MGVEEIEAEIESIQARIERNTARGDDANALEPLNIELQRAERRLAKEEAKLPVHPALVFGPIAQTVAAMSCISLGMSVSDLPYEMYPFYRLFSTITSLAVICLVVRSGIIYYEYSSIISSVPELTSEDKYKEAKFEDWLQRMALANRPDDWLHTRSHPSHFLTTRHAPPRMFPFPLGKTSAKATIKDELWWEGGHAPHVGHFNKPKEPIAFSAPYGTITEKWFQRAKKRLEIDDTRALWKRRIRSIQLLSIVVITSFIYRKAAIILLIYLIYNTLSTEIETMLQPPRSLDDLQRQAKSVEHSIMAEQAPKSKTFKYGVQGMGYVYQPEDVSRNENSQIPINTTAAHVLMTTADNGLAGPGQRFKGSMNYSAL